MNLRGGENTKARLLAVCEALGNPVVSAFSADACDGRNGVRVDQVAALAGTYHAFAFRKYAHRYLADVQYRFNRRLNLKSILARLARAAVITGPNPSFAWLR